MLPSYFWWRCPQALYGGNFVTNTPTQETPDSCSFEMELFLSHKATLVYLRLLFR